MNKTDLHRTCLELLKTQISERSKAVIDAQESVFSNAKSSAGDKHETGRAMLQLEREKLGKQLANNELNLEILAKINSKGPSSKVGLGSLVVTSKAQYFLGISAGAFQHGSRSVYCISMATPIGKLLLGRATEDKVTFNGEEITVVAIY